LALHQQSAAANFDLMLSGSDPRQVASGAVPIPQRPKLSRNGIGGLEVHRATCYLADNHATPKAITIWEELVPTLVGFGRADEAIEARDRPDVGGPQSTGRPHSALR
jgi:hypothetical protein